ncbi:MAG: beta-ketoacyl synthase [Planctomycetes bacterium]|nr:beta-ketoacyl synthase [Planctomycetota bacterium]
MSSKKRLGIFGWGVVAPQAPNVEVFEKKLETACSWLEPFQGFGPSNFLVGHPEFDFALYRPWIDARFEPRRYTQLAQKAGSTVKFAIGAFVQALGQNPGLEQELRDLGPLAHVYVGTGLGDFPLIYRISIDYYEAQREWNRFWCRPEHNEELAAYQAASPEEREELRRRLHAPEDPEETGTAGDRERRADTWFAFWVHSSRGLRQYLQELQEIEIEGIHGDVESEKGHLIRRKMTARRKLNARWRCPTEPWESVDANILWNIPNIPAAQITMLGRITGASFSPVAACAGFGTALSLAARAIRSGEARAVVVGMTDPEPHPLSVGAFFQARVVSHDGQVCKPFTAMRGTHISGGACVWIVGDADYLAGKGMKPLGLEILGIALSSDAEHIITPSREGPQRAIRGALAEAGIEPGEVTTWDLHATATPGDWAELQNALDVFGATPFLTARKGSFGHGMSVCGGWELTAQHMGFSTGKLHPVDLQKEDLHRDIAPYHQCLVGRELAPLEGGVAGKINMGVGGVNACVICRRWGDGPPLGNG